MTTTFVEWEGRLWESQHGDPVAEHHAVRAKAGVWDLSPLRKWRLQGKDLGSALDRIMTNEMRGLQVGQARYSAFCDSRGRMLGDAVIMSVAPDRAWVFTARDADGSHFRHVLAGRPVVVEDFTDEMACVQLQGPWSRHVLRRLCGRLEITNLGYFRLFPRPVDVGGVPCLVARLGYSGELGYELFCPMPDRLRLRDALAGAGAHPYGLAAAETLRIEAGLIMLGRDYLPGVTNPYDVSLDRVIRPGTDPFEGQGPLSVSAHRHRLGTMVWEGRDVPGPGSAVLDDGRLVGRLTSGCWSPTFRTGVGLSILEHAAASPGRALTIRDHGAPIRAWVSTTPLYDPARRRVRG